METNEALITRTLKLLIELEKQAIGSPALSDELLRLRYAMREIVKRFILLSQPIAT